MRSARAQPPLGPEGEPYLPFQMSLMRVGLYLMSEKVTLAWLPTGDRAISPGFGPAQRPPPAPMPPKPPAA